MPSILSVKKDANSLHFWVERSSVGICVGGLVSPSMVANRVCALLVLLLMILEKKVSSTFQVQVVGTEALFIYVVTSTW